MFFSVTISTTQHADNIHDFDIIQTESLLIDFMDVWPNSEMYNYDGIDTCIWRDSIVTSW